MPQASQEPSPRSSRSPRRKTRQVRKGSETPADLAGPASPGRGVRETRDPIRRGKTTPVLSVACLPHTASPPQAAARSAPSSCPSCSSWFTLLASVCRQSARRQQAHLGRCAPSPVGQVRWWGREPRRCVQRRPMLSLRVAVRRSDRELGAASTSDRWSVERPERRLAGLAPRQAARVERKGGMEICRRRRVPHCLDCSELAPGCCSLSPAGDRPVPSSPDSSHLH
jgi:hypothetical protein